LPTGKFDLSINFQMSKLASMLQVTDGLFEVGFQMQRLAQNAFLLPGQVHRLVPAALKLAEQKGPRITAQAVRKMVRRIPFPGPASESTDFHSSTLATWLYECATPTGSRMELQYAHAKRHKKLFMVHQALVTPAGIYLEGPELEPGNRVLRKYQDQVTTNFLKVRFKDEDGDTIRYDRANSLHEIHQIWFQSVLKQPITIAGKQFSFLGFSNSSLKEQACWYMAPFLQNGRLLNARHVIQDLGDFSHIHSPAKCAARIGQAFSDTQGGSLDTKSTTIETINDVKRGERVFSDGCGTASRELMQRMWKTYRRNLCPTSFQIRFAGAKGMITLDDTLTGEKLCIRPSMTKFESNDKNIEICDSSHRPLPFYLNRQIIKILEDLGVPSEAFMHLQAKAVAALRATAESPLQAARFLERFSIGSGCRLPWFIEKLEQVGLSPFKDDFLLSCIENAVLMQLRLLKHKARIYVENAHTLFGVMDEYEVLDEGEVLVRANGKTLHGLAAITRSPALHPGDIQMVRAVYVPEDCSLKELDNCVVFSQKGERDLPSKLSGGDLDGDRFNIIFDPQLLPVVTCAPADYPRATPIDLYRTMGEEDITNWFIQFMENDQLARIATMHQQVADCMPDGTHNTTSLELAELHSVAVDFQKSGIAVDTSKVPRTKPARPDFMSPDPRLLLNEDGQADKFEIAEFVESDDERDDVEKAFLNPDQQNQRTLFYQSQKVLGKLYRAIDERAFLEELKFRHHPGAKKSVLTERLFAYIVRQTKGIQWDHLLDWARGIREEYEELMIETMYHYSSSPRQPLSEVEVFTGEILGKRGSLPSRQLREEAKNMKEQFNDGVAYVVKRITHGNDIEQDEDNDALYEDEEAAQWADTSSMRDEALERSIACLCVSMEPGQEVKGLRGERLESFQYVAGSVALRECEIFKRLNAPAHLGLPVQQY